MATFPIPPEQRLIRTYTGRAEQPIRTIFIGAAEGARALIDVDELTRLIAGNFGRLGLEQLRVVVHFDTMIGRLSLDLRPLFDQLLFRSASAGELVFAELLGVEPIDFARFRVQAIARSNQIVGDLIQGITTGRINPITGVRSPGQLETVRSLIADSFDLGRPHPQTARLVSGVIGLDNRRALALERYARELEAAGVPERERLRLIERERARKLKSRGLAVSRTEAIRAASSAQDMIWDAAVEEGQIEPDLWEQQWVKSVTACEICTPLHGTRAPIGGTFPAPGGKGPPSPHPHCNCGRRLVRREE